MLSVNSRSAAILKALGHPTRISIISLLARGELCVCEMLKVLPVSQSTLSKHLAVLRAEDLLDYRRESSKVFYSLRHQRTADIAGLASQLAEERWHGEGALWQQAQEA